MKKPRSVFTMRCFKATAAGTIAAFAVMFGVSQAATIGFHFQTRYCEEDSYSGTIVTAPAFGIDPLAWQNLAQMDSGVRCFGAPFTLNQRIDPTTVAGGLNPLPQGSLEVTWTASSAYASGFGGYSRAPGDPGFEYAGSGHLPGEEEVYWGFLRDAANFGPISGQGYTIEIEGLLSVFGTHPYVVQLIASSDAAWSMTNAFIIDASLPVEVSQSVTYENFAPIRDLQDSVFPRGVGGGLSTVSGSLTADRLKIIGNTAEHGPGFNNASTIAGFIITDNPVVTMSPRSIFGSPGDMTTLRAIAIGPQPLALQWRKDGVAIPGAVNAALPLGALALNHAGNYDLVANNSFGSATSKVATVTVDKLAIQSQPYVLDSKPAGVLHHARLLGAVLQASNKDAANVSRTSVLQFSGANNDQVVLPGSADFDTPEGAIAFWMRSAGTVASPGTDAAMLVDRRAGAGLIIIQNDAGSLRLISSGNDFTSNISVTDNKWHHIIVNYDQSEFGSIHLYIDGVLDSTLPNENAWTWPALGPIEIGKSHDGRWKAYDGFLDDVRIYNRQLSDDEVAAIPARDALVADALVERLNFESVASGVSITWQSPNATLQSAENVEGPYTNVDSATSPHSAVAVGTARFYRYSHTATVIFSNPYDM